MKKYIHIKKEDREFIMRAFDISEKSVFSVIRFGDRRGDTDLVKKVRKLVMDRGGIVMVGAPETETLFDADGCARQHLSSNMMPELNKETGDCEVFHKGEKVRRYEDVKVVEIEGTQSWILTLR